MKDIIEFELDGQPVYVEAEPAEAAGVRRISRTEEGIVKAETRFADAISRILPVADALLKTLQEMSPPGFRASG